MTLLCCQNLCAKLSQQVPLRSRVLPFGALREVFQTATLDRSRELENVVMVGTIGHLLVALLDNVRNRFPQTPAAQ